VLSLAHLSLSLTRSVTVRSSWRSLVLPPSSCSAEKCEDTQSPRVPEAPPTVSSCPGGPPHRVSGCRRPADMTHSPFTFPFPSWFLSICPFFVLLFPFLLFIGFSFSLSPAWYLLFVYPTHLLSFYLYSLFPLSFSLSLSFPLLYLFSFIFSSLYFFFFSSLISFPFFSLFFFPFSPFLSSFSPFFIPHLSLWSSSWCI